MSHKVVRNAGGAVVAFGPDDGAYEPVVRDGETMSIEENFVIPDAAPKTQFTSLEFLDRFTEPEQLSVVQATMVSAPVKLWYDRLLAASFVDLEDPRTEFGVDALITAGLVAAERKTAILQPGE